MKKILLIGTLLGAFSAYAITSTPPSTGSNSVGTSGASSAAGTVNSNTNAIDPATTTPPHHPYPPSTSNPNVQGDTQIQHGSSTTNATTGTTDSIRH